MIVFLYDEAMYPSRTLPMAGWRRPGSLPAGDRVLGTRSRRSWPFADLGTRSKAEISDNGRGGRVVSLQVVKRSATAIEPSHPPGLWPAQFRKELGLRPLFPVSPWSRRRPVERIRGIHFGRTIMKPELLYMRIF